MYIVRLHEYLLPSVSEKHPNGFVFPKYSASTHKSHGTKEFISEPYFDLLDWPGVSPDLNPMENCGR